MTVRSVSKRRFYLYEPDANNFASVGFPINGDTDTIAAIHWTDTPLLPTWKPRRCHVFDEAPPLNGDFPSVCNFGGIPLMSERALTVLWPLIGYCCEVLPIIHPSHQPYFIVHVMNTIDALDVGASKVSYSKVRKDRINGVYHYSFDTAKLRGQCIFKLPHLRGAHLLVDSEFRTIVEANGLKGLLFNELP